MWHPDSFLQLSYEQASREYAFKASNEAEWSVWREQLKPKFIELLGGFPQVKSELKVKLIEEVDCLDHIRQRVEFESYPGFAFPAYVLIPKNISGKLPAVIACHGHGYGSKDTVGLEPDGAPRKEATYHKDFALELMRKGFLVIVPELLGFGDTRLKEDAAKPPWDNSCYRIATNLLMMGQTLAGHRIYQIIRTLDYLETRADVDMNRIGCMGISGGGLVAGFTAAVDDRIKAVVVSGYVNLFRDSIMAVHHCVDNFIPGILQYAEMPDILALNAPRPMLVEAGTKDHIFPIEATREAIRQLEQVYEVLGVPERLEQDVFKGGHEISGQKAYDWLKRWL